MEKHNFPGCLIIPPSTTVQVKGYVKKPEDDYEQGRGYIDEKENTVYIFSANGKPRNVGLKPYFWISDGAIVKSKTSSLIQKDYSADLIDWYSLEDIIANTSKDDVMMTPEQINDINLSSNRMLPTINEDDDFLKKSTKMAMHCKNIILAKLKSATNMQWQFNNLKTALTKATKLTPPNFCKWMELLGINFTMHLYDNGADTLDPMTSTVIYRSKENKVYDRSHYYMAKEDFSSEVISKTAEELDAVSKSINTILQYIDDRDHKGHLLTLELKDTLRSIDEMRESIV